MIQRVYIDTSVIGGCFDKEFSEWSNLLFEDFKQGRRIAVISDITLDELSDAPQPVKDNFESIPDESLEIVISEKEARLLADEYIKEKAVSAKFYEDALHISLSG